METVHTKSHELYDIQKIIDYMKATDADSWASDVCRTADGRNCFLGHLYEYGGSDKKTEQANDIINWFEDAFATTYMFFPVNDGTHPGYPQKSQRDRIVAYLEDLRDHEEKRTWGGIDIL